MQKYKCTVCGYIYDPEKGDPDSGIRPGIPFEELPDDWVVLYAELINRYLKKRADEVKNEVINPIHIYQCMAVQAYVMLSSARGYRRNS